MISEILESDNGPQFSSREFTEFNTHWNFENTSSPYLEGGRGVQIANNILRKCKLD